MSPARGPLESARDRRRALLFLLGLGMLPSAACGGGGHTGAGTGGSGMVPVEGTCQIPASGAGGAGGASSTIQSLRRIGCTSDFQALASAPIDVSLPGARSGKVVLDQADG